MKTPITLFFLLSFVCNSLIGQVILKGGYIQMPDGQKIEGFISLIASKKSTDQVFFSKTGLKDSFKKYLPTDIKGYGINNKIQFESFKITPFGKYQIPSENRVTKFLELVTTGKIKLYQYKNTKEAQYFLLKDKNLIPLGYQKKAIASYQNNNGQIVINGEKYENLSPGDSFKDKLGNSYIFEDQLYRKTPEYLTILRKKLGDFKSIQIAPNLEYDKNDLSQLIHKYNKWASPLTAKINNGPKFFQLALLTSGGRTSYYHDRFGHQEVGLMAEIRNNYKAPNISLAIGFGITNSGTSTYVIPYSFPVGNQFIEFEDIIEETVKFQTTTFRLNYHFRPFQQLRPFIYGGVKFLKAQTKVENFTRPDVETPANTRSLFAEHLGVGIDYYLNRFQLRTEFGFTGSLTYSIGVGYLLLR